MKSQKCHILFPKNINHFDKHKVIFICLIIFQIIFTIYGALKIGISTDEGAEIIRAQNDINTVFHTNYLSEQAAKEYESLISNEIYGSVNYIFAHFMQNIVTLDFLNMNIDESILGYKYRHIYISLIGIVMIFTFIYTFFLYHFKLKEVNFFLLVYFSFQVWIGHTFFNPKDVPFAVGLTVVNLALSNLFLNISLKHENINYFLIFTGCTISIGARSTALFLIIISIIIFIFFGSTNNLKIKKIFIVIILSLIFVDFWNTNLSFLNFDQIKSVLFNSTKFEFYGQNLVFDQIVSQNPPWWYLPIWFAFSIPELSLIGLIAFIFSISIKNKKKLNLLLTLFGMQTFLVPLYSVIFKATIYDANRHFLFIYPSLILFTFLGFVYLYSKIKFKSLFLFVFSFFYLINVLYPAIKFFPYNYSFLNTVSTFWGINNRWEIDYWLTSLKEASQLIGNDAEVLNWYEYWWGPYYQYKNLKNEIFNYAVVPVRYSYSDKIINGRRPYDVPDGCHITDSVKRNVYLENIYFAFILKCGNTLTNLHDTSIKLTSNLPLEVDKDTNSFIWIDNGATLQIFNESLNSSNVELKIFLDNNPCNYSYNYVYVGKEKILQGRNSINPILIEEIFLIKPMESVNIQINLRAQKQCKVILDSRNLNAKIMIKNFKF